MSLFEFLVLLWGLWVVVSIFGTVIYYFDHREQWKP